MDEGGEQLTYQVQVEGDEMVLDVSTKIDEVQVRLAQHGFTRQANAAIPETDRQIVLVDAPQLEPLRTIYAFGKPVARWLIAWTLSVGEQERPTPPAGRTASSRCFSLAVCTEKGSASERSS